MESVARRVANSPDGVDPRQFDAVVEAAKHIPFVCLYLRPFADTSLDTKVAAYVTERRELTTFAEIVKAQLDTGVNAEVIAGTLEAKIKNEEGLDHTIRASRPDRHMDYALHDVQLMRALSENVMAYCLGAPSDGHETDADFVWDGGFWHFNMPWLLDGNWSTGPDGELTTDALFQDLIRNDWRVGIKVLADQTALFLMVPSARRGTRWELQFLKSQQLLERTIFVKPPYIGPEDWAITRRHLRDEFILPEYRPGGFVFTVETKRSHTTKVGWSEIADYTPDIEHMRSAMFALRPTLMANLCGQRSDMELPEPWLFRELIQRRFPADKTSEAGI